jgi:hypothetical protein
MKRDIDAIITQLRKEFPTVIVEQLEATHQADDVGIWFVRIPKGNEEIQLESSNGDCPFLVEWTITDERFTESSVIAVVGRLGDMLRRLPRP